MPKFACVCGNVINLSHGTSESEFSLVPERKIDEVGEALSVRWLPEEEFYDLVGQDAMTVYRCKNCGRLHLDLGGGKFNSYIREAR